MREPVIALAFTPEPWVEALHRHLTDHGGARVRQLLLDPALALSEDYEVLVTSARWPALTAGLVADLHDRGRAVVGVAGLDDPGAQDLLRNLGVDHVVAADAAPSEFIAALLIVRRSGRGPEDVGDPAPAPTAGEDRPTGRRVVVRGPGGAGATEIAIGIGAALARDRRVALVDADDVAPAVAVRLGLPLEPNLRHAVEIVEHGLGAELEPEDSEGLHVVAGMANPAAWAQFRPSEVDRVVRSLTRTRDVVLVDVAGRLDDEERSVRPRHAVARAMLGGADAIVAVGDASPLGIVRLLGWLADAHQVCAPVPVHVVLNRAPRRGFELAELRAELMRSYEPESLHVVPDDPRVRAAAWNGALVRRGAFASAVEQVARCVA